MEWNPVLEDKLKRAKRSSAWRWVGYGLIVLGLWVAGAGWAFYIDGKEKCTAGGSTCQGPNPWLYTGPGLVVFLLGLFIAVPAQKSVKEARELTIQKAAAGK